MPPTVPNLPSLLELEVMRPERSDAAENRSAILAAAREMLAERPIQSITMTDLATHAGVGQGNVVSNGTCEQEWFLGDKRYLSPECVNMKIPNIHTVQQNSPGGDIIQSR